MKFALETNGLSKSYDQVRAEFCVGLGNWLSYRDGGINILQPVNPCFNKGRTLQPE